MDVSPEVLTSCGTRRRVEQSHPTPSASLSGFGVFFLWSFFGRSGRCRLRGVASLGSLPLLLCCSMRNACVTRRREVDKTSTPSTRIIITTIVLSLLGFWTRDGVPLHTPYIMCSRSVLVPPLPSAEPQSVARKGKWGGNRTVTQMLWTSVGQNQVVFLVRIAPVSSRNPV